MFKIISTVFLLLLFTSCQNEDIKSIIKKSEKAVGYDALKDIKSIEQSATIEIKAMKLKGSLKVQIKMDKILISSQVGPMTEAQGYNGKVAWSENISTGMRTLEGPEKLKLVGETLRVLLKPESFYDEIKLEGEEEFNGKNCYKVAFIKKGLDPRYQFINSSSFLPEGMIDNVITAQGKMTITSRFTAYAQHKNGFKYPSSMEQEMGPVKINISVSDFQVNTKIDDASFNPPQE